MTESEWLTCTDPPAMLQFLGDRFEDRHYRFLVAACLRRIWHLLPDEACQRAVRLCEMRASFALPDSYLDEAANGIYEAEPGPVQLAVSSALITSGPYA